MAVPPDQFIALEAFNAHKEAIFALPAFLSGNKKVNSSWIRSADLCVVKLRPFFLSYSDIIFKIARLTVNV